MSFPETLRREHPCLGREAAILLAYRGSIAHGTYEPSSEPGSIDDKDAIGVAVPGLDHYIGQRQFGSRGTVEIVSDPWDIVIYEARKAIHLLAKGNPNVLSLLWLERPFYIDLTPPGERLIEARDLFATRSTFHPLMGYASSQLTKMERGAFKGYMGEKRKRLVAQHGYDTKNAAHLIRLLRMGVEFMRDGELQVRRPDAPELLAIKHGEWTLEQVKAEAERLSRRAEAAHAASTLPDQPDPDAINALTVAVIGEALGLR
jgi:predicted nucleotidyltransferase